MTAKDQFDVAKSVVGLLFVLVLGCLFIPPSRLIVLGAFILFITIFIVGALIHSLVRPPPSATKDHQPWNESHSLPELIQSMRTLDWYQFEKLVGAVYRKFGYTVTECGGANPDGGIDLVLEKDGVRTGIQCKQWKTWSVGVKPIREFLGALTDQGLSNGIFVTLCGYSAPAKELAQKHGIQILDEAGLAKLLETANARFDPEMLALLHDTRKMCPRCKCEMVLRTARTGRGAGQQFWGCSAYPRCRCTMPV